MASAIFVVPTYHWKAVARAAAVFPADESDRQGLTDRRDSEKKRSLRCFQQPRTNGDRRAEDAVRPTIETIVEATATKGWRGCRTYPY